jgi:NAD-dependent dihydropyrimidine dehydrogenase PreA subunit
MSAAWYYARDNQAVGPLSSAQLKELADSGGLGPTDLVLRAGSRKWVAAGAVKGLFPPPPPPPPCPAAVDPVIASRQQALTEAQVVPDAANCVQCGMCSYNCPMGIDVRAHAWRGLAIHDSHCLTCGECVKRCPRGVLRFERLALFTAK